MNFFFTNYHTVQLTFPISEGYDPSLFPQLILPITLRTGLFIPELSSHHSH